MDGYWTLGRIDGYICSIKSFPQERQKKKHHFPKMKVFEMAFS